MSTTVPSETEHEHRGEVTGDAAVSFSQWAEIDALREKLRGYYARAALGGADDPLRDAIETTEAALRIREDGRAHRRLPPMQETGMPIWRDPDYPLRDGAIYYGDFSHHGDKVSERTDRKQPSGTWVTEERWWNGDGCPEARRQRQDVQQEEDRRRRVFAWAREQGIDDAYTYEELTMEIMHRHWHLAQLVSNEVSNQISLPWLGMEMAHLNLEADVALRKAVDAFDPEHHTSLAECAIPLMHCAILGEMMRRGGDRTYIWLLREWAQDEGEYAVVGGRAERYAAIAGEMENGNAPTEELKDILFSCSRQERLVVRLHRERKETMAEIGMLLGLTEENIAKTYEAVLAGRKGGRNAKPLPDWREPLPEGEELHGDPYVAYRFDEEKTPRLPAIHYTVNLDREFQHAEEVVPEWAEGLSEADLMRLQWIFLDPEFARKVYINWKEIVAFFEGIGHPIARDPSNLKRTAIGMAAKHRSTLAFIQNRLRDPHRTFDISPMFLRARDVDHLTAPNLRLLVQRHFQRLQQAHGLLHFRRTLLDVGAWNGRLTRLVADGLFDNVIAMEPDETRFRMLCDQSPGHWTFLNTTIQEHMEGPHRSAHRADVVLLSQMLYYMQQENDDEEALLWAMEALRPGGMAIVVLRDATPRPSTTAHLRQTLGVVHESNMPPRRYADFLADRGFRVEFSQPLLRLKATTEHGKMAMRDVLRFLLPDDYRQEQPLSRYMRRYVEGRGENGEALFDYPICILTARRGTM